MADEKDFAKELNALIKRYVDGGCDPQDIADELLREANYVFGHYNQSHHHACGEARGNSVTYALSVGRT